MSVIEMFKKIKLVPLNIELLLQLNHRNLEWYTFKSWRKRIFLSKNVHKSIVYINYFFIMAMTVVVIFHELHGYVDIICIYVFFSFFFYTFRT